MVGIVSTVAFVPSTTILPRLLSWFANAWFSVWSCWICCCSCLIWSAWDCTVACAVVTCPFKSVMLEFSKPVLLALPSSCIWALSMFSCNLSLAIVTLSFAISEASLEMVVLSVLTAVFNVLTSLFSVLMSLVLVEISPWLVETVLFSLSSACVKELISLCKLEEELAGKSCPSSLSSGVTFTGAGVGVEVVVLLGVGEGLGLEVVFGVEGLATHWM